MLLCVTPRTPLNLQLSPLCTISFGQLLVLNRLRTVARGLGAARGATPAGWCPFSRFTAGRSELLGVLVRRSPKSSKFPLLLFFGNLKVLCRLE